MRQDLFYSEHRPQSRLRALVQQRLHQALDLHAQSNAPGEGQLLCDHSFIDLLGVATVEGREASHHLVEQSAKTVVVDREAVSFFENHFWRHVLRRAAEGVGLLVSEHVGLGEPEVGDPDVSLEVQEDVLGLDVAVDDGVVVQVLDAEQDFDEVEASGLLVELVVLFDVGEELASGTVLHDEDDKVVGFEGLFQFYQEGVVDVHHYVSLNLDYHLPSLLSYQFFLYEFHGVELTVQLASHKVHLRETACPDALQHLVVQHTELLFLALRLKVERLQVQTPACQEIQRLPLESKQEIHPQITRSRDKAHDFSALLLLECPFERGEEGLRRDVFDGECVLEPPGGDEEGDSAEFPGVGEVPVGVGAVLVRAAGETACVVYLDQVLVEEIYFQTLRFKFDVSVFVHVLPGVTPLRRVLGVAQGLGVGHVVGREFVGGVEMELVVGGRELELDFAGIVGRAFEEVEVEFEFEFLFGQMHKLKGVP